jgi:hypothetical protein
VNTTLATLFGSRPKPTQRVPHAVIDEEAALMEALAEAEEDECTMHGWQKKILPTIFPL